MTTRVENRRRINRAYHIDRKALEIAMNIDDIFAQGHPGVAVRTSKVQLLIQDVLEMWVLGALERHHIPELNYDK